MALREYLYENRAKNCIHPPRSAARAPILFVKKRESIPRHCVDEQALNTITIKNKYSLLLLNELLERIGSAKIFQMWHLYPGLHPTGNQWNKQPFVLSMEISWFMVSVMPPPHSGTCIPFLDRIIQTPGSPFYPSYSFCPQFQPSISPITHIPKVSNLFQHIHHIQGELKSHLNSAKEDYKQYADLHQQKSSSVSVRDKMWLSTQPLDSFQSLRKLDHH